MPEDVVIEDSFLVDVADLFAEPCATCGFALALSTEHVGAIGISDDGTTEVRMWHRTCAPSVLQAEYARERGE